MISSAMHIMSKASKDQTGVLWTIRKAGPNSWSGEGQNIETLALPSFGMLPLSTKGVK